MKKSMSALSIVLALIACGQDDKAKIENAIRSSLNDPSSAQFKDFVISTRSRFACVSWNAKNKMGGYSDWQLARFRNNGGEWVAQPARLGSSDFHLCTLENLNKSDQNF